MTPLVQQQRAALPEAFPAGVADECPPCIVCGAMHLQMCGLCEASVAYVTAERPEAQMDEVVAPQVGRDAEALPTGVAAEGLLSGVDATVHRQAAPAGEAAPTLLAGVWTLTCVRPQVSCEAALLAERLPADAAGERLQSSVDSQLMDIHAAVRGEAFATVWTFIGFVLQVDLLMSRQVPTFGELFPTLCTSELLVQHRTPQLVPSQAASGS